MKEWDQPNAVNYPLQLLGFDGFVVLPSFGLAGLVGLVYFARSKGPEAIFGRFSIAALAGMLAIHLPYGYQSGRYMIIPGALLTVAAAAIITRTARALWRKGSGVEAA